MAIRNARHILKNSDIVNRPLPTSLLKGEPIVNTADGIMYFSGVTTSTNEWTPAGVGGAASFFEVGSNLYDLRLRNRITKYEGASGASLVGKFLSGTTSGFTLANISEITANDTYTTGFTYSPNTLTISRNSGLPALSVNINSFSGLTIAGTLSATSITTPSLTATTATITNLSGVGSLSATSITATTISATTYLNLPLDVRVTGGTYNAGTATFTNNSGGTFNVTGFTTTDTFTTAFTYNNNTLTINQNQGQPSLAATINTMTGLTINGLLSASTANITNLSGVVSLSAGTITGDNFFINGGIQSYSGLTNLAGQFLSGTTSGFTLGAISAITGVDTFTTGFTYNPATNRFTITRNLGQPDLTADITAVSGLTISSLTPGRVVFVGSGGTLSDDTGFTYDPVTNILSVPTDGTVNVGTGGLNVAGDTVIQGSLTIFGPSVSAFTSQLYVEDPNITINYNPTGSTTVTSVNAGITVQDGSGLTGGTVNLDIVRMQNLTGLTASFTPDVSEYTGPTGYVNRGWITQLNDIVIRSTDASDEGSAGDFNGVRVLTEFDVLDGGNY